MHMLNAQKLLTQDSLNTILQSFPVCKILKKANLPILETLEHIKLSASHYPPSDVMAALQTLQASDLLTVEHIKLMASSGNTRINRMIAPYYDNLTYRLGVCAMCINLLYIIHIPLFFSAVFGVIPLIIYSLFIPVPFILYKGICNVNHNRKWIGDITLALQILKRADLLTAENAKLVANHKQPNNLAFMLKILKETGLLTVENVKLMANRYFSRRMVAALNTLKEVDLLTAENIRLIAFYKQIKISGFVNASSKLRACNLLTRGNIISLLGCAKCLEGKSFWRRTRPWFDALPNHLVTQEVFDALIQIGNSQHPDVQTALNAYVQWVLNNDNEAHRGRNVLNGPENTHIASVHQTASKSAKRLKDLYGEKLSNQALELMSIAINTSSLQEQNIRDSINCINRIYSSNNFTDPESGITLKELLLLTYLAINDDTKISSSKEDALKAWMDGLYEIQRGNNLLNGIDDEREDDFICPAGAFNKLINALEGVHSDCNINFITPDMAAYKLPCVIKEASLTHLKDAGLKAVDVDQETWDNAVIPNIQAKVIERMLDEFSSLYTGETDEKLTSMVGEGLEYFDINKLSAEMAKFSDSREQVTAAGSDTHHDAGIRNRILLKDPVNQSKEV